MGISIKITFQNQQERYQFFHDIFGKEYHLKCNEPFDVSDGIKITILPYKIFESVEVPSDLQFFFHLALGYSITKSAEFLYSKIKNRKIKSISIEDSDIELEINKIEKRLEELQEKLSKK